MNNPIPFTNPYKEELYAYRYSIKDGSNTSFDNAHTLITNVFYNLYNESEVAWLAEACAKHLYESGHPFDKVKILIWIDKNWFVTHQVRVTNIPAFRADYYRNS